MNSRARFLSATAMLLALPFAPAWAAPPPIRESVAICDPGQNQTTTPGSCATVINGVLSVSGGGGGGGGGGGAVTAAPNSYAAGSIVDLGTGSSPAANTVNANLQSLIALLNAPLLPSGAATAAGQTNIVNALTPSGGLPVAPSNASQIHSDLQAILNGPLNLGNVTATFAGALPQGTNNIGTVNIGTAPNLTLTNTSFGISGSLPAFAATPTFNIGTAPNLTLTNTSFGISGTLPAFATTPTVNIGTAPNFTISNTAFGISGQLPAFAATPTFNCGTGCYQATQPVSGTVTANQGGAPWSTAISGTLPAFAATPTFNLGTGGLGTSGSPIYATVTNPGSASGGNPAAGTTGAAVPAAADYTGFANASGNLTGVSATNPLPIGGAVTASNLPTITPSGGTPGVVISGGVADGNAPLTYSHPIAGTDSGGLKRTIRTNTTGQITLDPATTINVTTTPASGATSTVVQPTAANLNATVVGTGTLAVQNTAATPSGANVIGSTGTTSTPDVVAGNVANGAIDAGGSVKAGGVFNTATGLSTALTAGQRGDAQLDAYGHLQTTGADMAPITVTSQAATGTLFTVDTTGYEAATFAPSGTWAGTITFYGSNDNANYYVMACVNSQASYVQAITTNTGVTCPAVTRYIRGIVSAYTSGTINGTGYLRRDFSASFPQSISASISNVPTVSAQGTVASGNTDSGNAVKAGGVYNATPPTYSTGQRGDLQLDSNGAPFVDTSRNTVANAGVVAGAGVGVVAVGEAAHSAAVGPTQTQATSAQLSANGFVVKASAGNFYGWNVCMGSTAAFAELLNTTTVPAAGVTIAPVRALFLAASQCIDVPRDIPLAEATGLTLVVTTTPFTMTAPANPAVFADVDYK